MAYIYIWYLVYNIKYIICVYLLAGHDTTIMPLLAVLLTKDLWDGKWAPYGALLSLELYSATEKNVEFLFRLVYNGKPLILKSCAASLCDVAVLLDILSFGQKESPEACKPIPGKSHINTSDHETTANNNNKNAPEAFSLFFVCMTAVLTSVSSVVCMYYLFVCEKRTSSRNAYGNKYSVIDSNGNCSAADQQYYSGDTL